MLCAPHHVSEEITTNRGARVEQRSGDPSEVAFSRYREPTELTTFTERVLEMHSAHVTKAREWLDNAACVSARIVRTSSVAIVVHPRSDHTLCDLSALKTYRAGSDGPVWTSGVHSESLLMISRVWSLVDVMYGRSSFCFTRSL